MQWRNQSDNWEGGIFKYFCSSKVNTYILNIFIFCRAGLKERH